METVVYALIWLFILEIFSYTIYPAISIFSKGLTDRGFALSKFLGILIAAYLMWLTSSLHILPFTQLTTIIVALVVLGGFLFVSLIKVKARERIINRMIDEKLAGREEEEMITLEDAAIHTEIAKEAFQTEKSLLKFRLFNNKHFTKLVDRFVAQEEFTSADEFKSITKIMIIEEILFIAGFFVWVYLRGIYPTIMGTEKFMDFGIINALLRSSYMPPHDMWLSGFSLNYYYYGQYIFAFIIRLSGIPAAYGYNLAIATIFGLAFTLTFSIVHTLSKKIYAAVLSAFVLTAAGNINFVLAFIQYLQQHGTLNGFSFWYPTSTRLIPYTINEYPIYSFIVADLHAHFTDIPVVLISLLISINIFFKRKFEKVDIAISALVIGTMGATNSWDAAFYASILFVILLYLYTIQDKRIDFLNELDLKGKLIALKAKINAIKFKSIMDVINNPFVEALTATCVTGLLGIILFFPYYLFFKAPVDGIGFNTMAHSDPNYIVVLFGFFFFFIASYLLYLVYALLTKKPFHGSDFIVLYLVILGIILIILPEFFYLKDIFYKANPPYFRANTVFKLYYQSWILFSIATGYIIARINGLFTLRDIARIAKVILSIWNIAGVILLVCIFAYTVEAINEAYLSVTFSNATSSLSQSCLGGVCINTFKTDNGTDYLKTDHPEDAQLIDWLNTHAPDNAVIVEAIGDSYTYFGRISVNTGLATVLGWPNHEYQWRNTYAYSDQRIKDVFNLYNAGKLSDVKNLIEKYHISYIIVGIEERNKYPTINESLLRQVGKIVFISGSSYIIQTSF